MFSNSCVVPKNVHLNSFFTTISETIQSNLKFFYFLEIFDLIRKFIPKIYYSVSKKSNWWVDLVFEIYLDSKFPVWEEIKENVYPNEKFHQSFWKL